LVGAVVHQSREHKPLQRTKERRREEEKKRREMATTQQGGEKKRTHDVNLDDEDDRVPSTKRTKTDVAFNGNGSNQEEMEEEEEVRTR